MKPAWSFVATLLLLVACDHTDPSLAGPVQSEGPFSDAQPVRLTYSSGEDGWPTVSADGSWLSYRYQRGTADRDFCAGILPVGGGARIVSLCAWESNDATRSDDFRSAVLLDDNTVSYTRHSSGTGNVSPQAAGLYVASLADLHHPRLALTLFARPAGASSNYAYLLDPVREDDHTILALAAGAYIGPTYPFGPPDTTYRGVEISRIDVATTPATVTPIAPAPDAIAWALDSQSGMMFFHRRYYSAEPGSGGFFVTADTIFRVPVAGGAATVAYGRGEAPGGYTAELDGFAAAAGQLFVAWHYSVPQPGDLPPITISQIVRVVDGQPGPVVATLGGGPTDHWGRLAATPDGNAIVAVSVRSGQRDLYQVAVN